MARTNTSQHCRNNTVMTQSTGNCGNRSCRCSSSWQRKHSHLSMCHVYFPWDVFSGTWRLWQYSEGSWAHAQTQHHCGNNGNSNVNIDSSPVPLWSRHQLWLLWKIEEHMGKVYVCTFTIFCQHRTIWRDIYPTFLEVAEKKNPSVLSHNSESGLGATQLNVIKK